MENIRCCDIPAVVGLVRYSIFHISTHM